jgi:hypothetical protein
MTGFWKEAVLKPQADAWGYKWYDSPTWSGESDGLPGSRNGVGVEFGARPGICRDF